MNKSLLGALASLIVVGFAAVVICLANAGADTEKPSDDVAKAVKTAEQATSLLATRCGNCHYGRSSLVKPGSIVPGKPEASKLYTTLGHHGAGRLAFTAAETKTIHDWIADGAIDPKHPPASQPADGYTRVFKFISLRTGKYRDDAVSIATLAPAMPGSGKQLECIIPNEPADDSAKPPKKPTPDEAIYKPFKEAKRGDLLKVQYRNNFTNQSIVAAAEPYQPKPDEDKPRVYFFCKKSIEKVSGRDREMIVVQKYAEESSLVVPLKTVDGKAVPDPQMMTVIDGLSADDAVEILKTGNTVTSIKVYKPTTKDSAPKKP